eukprot:scaffold36816_cov61-Phaeocystis_antarctica.AAC.2
MEGIQCWSGDIHMRTAGDSGAISVRLQTGGRLFLGRLFLAHVVACVDFAVQQGNALGDDQVVRRGVYGVEDCVYVVLGEALAAREPMGG